MHLFTLVVGVRLCNLRVYVTNKGVGDGSDFAISKCSRKSLTNLCWESRMPEVEGTNSTPKK